MSYKKAEPNHTRLPEFDPKPSGKFVSEVFRELDISGTLIGRLAVWAAEYWRPCLDKISELAELGRTKSTIKY